MKKISLILLFFIFLTGCGKADKDIPSEDVSSGQAAAASGKTDYSSISNKSCGFGYRKEAKGKIPTIGIYADYFKGMNVVYTGDTTKKNVYLTFDEGYENGYTADILNVLKEKQVPAAFFCTGDYLRRNGELISRMISEGHIIGNHTWNHPSMPEITDNEKLVAELTEFDEYLFEHHNLKTEYFRYPGGEFSERTLAIIKDSGYKTVFWSLAYKDWERDKTNGADYAVNQVTSQLHNGAIILLHAVSADNAEALPLIIDALRNEGYTFSSLNEIEF